jgi:hypothetical protein
MNGSLLSALLVLLALIGCSQQKNFDKFVPKDEAEFSKNYLALFPAHDFEAIEAKVDPKLKDATLRAKLTQIADTFPLDKARDIRVVGAQTFASGASTQFNLSFQYEYPTKWLLASVVLKKTGDALVVTGVNVKPLTDSLESINRFTFEGKGLSHYLIFLAAVLVPLIILVSLVVCIRTPIPKRKWLWVLFILFGFFELSFDWTTGAVNIDPVYFLLFGAGLFKPGPFGAVVISVSVPLGALIFLWRRKRWLSHSVRPRTAADGLR